MRDFDPKPPPAIAERRSYIRVPFLHPITIALSPDGRATEASSIDISLGGVGLSSRGSFQKGQVVVLTFRVKDPKLGFVSERVSGRVVNFVADFDGNRLGVEFLEPLRAETHPAAPARCRRKALNLNPSDLEFLLPIDQRRERR